VIAAVVLLTGCSWSQVFRLSLTVVNRTNGTPIAGAVVDVDTFATNEEGKNDPVPETGYQTNEAGRLDYDFSISGYTPTSSGADRWYLKVRKDGYEPVVVDIKPPPERKKDGPIPLAVTVEMRPVEKTFVKFRP
jgi:hypothetical protein